MQTLRYKHPLIQTPKYKHSPIQTPPDPNSPIQTLPDANTPDANTPIQTPPDPNTPRCEHPLIQTLRYKHPSYKHPLMLTWSSPWVVPGTCTPAAGTLAQAVEGSSHRSHTVGLRDTATVVVPADCSRHPDLVKVIHTD